MKERVTEAELLSIYWDTVEALYSYASRRCGGDRELAEDVTQEAWFRAVREWRAKGVPDNPLGWLTTVARNLIIDQLRRLPHVSLDAASPTDVLAAVDQDEVIDSAAVAAAVSQALARLPKGDAELLEAFYFERFKTAELAATYGVSERAIEGRLYRAREHLRREIVERSSMGFRQQPRHTVVRPNPLKADGGSS